MVDVPNDTLNRSMLSSMSSDRQTPDAMGGGTTDRAGETSRVAAAALAEAGERPEIDTRLSAAIERKLAERFRKTLRLRGSAVQGASGFAWACLFGPSEGFVWNVTRLVAGPIDFTALPFAANVTTLAVLGGQQPPPAGSITGDSVALVGTSWPYVATPGDHVITLEAGDYLWVGVAGLANGVTFTVGGEGAETAAHVREVYGL